MGEVMWLAQAARVSAFFETALAGGAGVYAHGSAALGGWTTASDLDLLVISTVTDADWMEIGQQLLGAVASEPKIELSVVSATTAGSPQAPWPFLLHVNQGDGRVVVDGGDGDPDLLMHYVVARSGGVTISGPSAADSFGPVPRRSVLQYLGDELAWGVEEADQRYAVLNACRALAYCESGLVLSKVDGGSWGLRRGLSSPMIESALSAQVTGFNLGPCEPEARALVAQCQAALADQLEAEDARADV